MNHPSNLCQIMWCGDLIPYPMAVLGWVDPEDKFLVHVLCTHTRRTYKVPRGHILPYPQQTH